MKKGVLLKVILLILIIAVFFSGCEKKITDMDSELSGKLEMVGSSSMQEVCDALAKSFMDKYPKIDVVKSGSGSGEAPRVVMNGIAQIGDLSRDLTEYENPQLFDKHIIAIDGIAICTNKTNNINNLSTEQIRGIFNGSIKNWSQVGGKDGAITIVGRNTASGIRIVFESIMSVEDNCKYAVELDNNGKVKEKIKSDPNAIGYISFSSVDDSVNALDVDFVKATEENIKNGQYTISIPFMQIVKKGTCDELIKAWFDHVYSPQGEDAIKSSKLIAVSRN